MKRMSRIRKLIMWLLIISMFMVSGGEVNAEILEETQPILDNGSGETSMESVETEESGGPEDAPVSEESTEITDVPVMEESGQTEESDEAAETPVAEGSGTVVEEELQEVTDQEEQVQAQAKNGWQKQSGVWFYYQNGEKATGWLSLSDGTYYLEENGAMVTGWYEVGGRQFYFRTAADEGTEGTMITGWFTIGNYRYYFQNSGAVGVMGRLVTGWLKQGGRIYYLKKTGDEGVRGHTLTGWQSIGGKHYYFKKTGSTKGSMFVGVLNINGCRYYFKETGTYGVRGEVQTGWQSVEGKTYYLREDGEKGVRGRALLGWQDIGNYRYYFMKTGDQMGKMLLGWQSIGGVKYYFKKTGDPGFKGRMFRGWQNINGKRYYFGTDGKLRTNTVIDGIQLGEDGSVVTSHTLKGLFQTALQPVGSTLYVLGGGHDASGTTIGVNPAWKAFFNKQTSAYEQTWSTVTDKSKGLDCSGYVGWVVYNTVNDTSGRASCSTYSYQTPALYKNRGWGSYYKAGYTAGDFKPGDVVAWRAGNTGHTWIVLGKCSDESYVVLHCTTASGPQLTGTMTKSGKVDSKAAKLAKKYMNQYYSGLVKKMTTFPSIGAREYVYGPESAGLYRFSWDLTGSKMLSDPDGYSSMSAEEILEDLF